MGGDGRIEGRYSKWYVEVGVGVEEDRRGICEDGIDTLNVRWRRSDICDGEDIE